ncbi:class I SAM-dependent methyltransferase [Plantactinospora sp. GCM10030261]|uniref:class I SAM-dependent methyltransferase n=1 Tax=Plantactinospora sp. GCM10030261 TaxID=3273420 RepID=UPI003612ACBF
MSGRSTVLAADTMGVAEGAAGAFAVPLAPRPGERHWLVQDDGRCLPLPARRWHGPAEPELCQLARRCTGPTVDVGCGPGRLTVAVARRGVVALGIDTSPVAVRLTRNRGADALLRDVFERLPDEGRWAHVLLVDGNVGIGGDPAALLRRCAELLRPGGSALVELARPGTGLWRGQAYVASGDRHGPRHRGPVFRWARLGIELLDGYASGQGLPVRAMYTTHGRWFAELVRR